MEWFVATITGKNSHRVPYHSSVLTTVSSGFQGSCLRRGFRLGQRSSKRLFATVSAGSRVEVTSKFWL